MKSKEKKKNGNKIVGLFIFLLILGITLISIPVMFKDELAGNFEGNKIRERCEVIEFDLVKGVVVYEDDGDIKTISRLWIPFDMIESNETYLIKEKTKYIGSVDWILYFNPDEGVKQHGNR